MTTDYGHKIELVDNDSIITLYVGVIADSHNDQW